MMNEVPLVATQPARPGAPCEWCWNEKGTKVVEITPPKVLKSGERKGEVEAPGTVIRACAGCAEKLERQRSDKEAAAELKRMDAGLRRRKEKPTQAQRLEQLDKAEQEAEAKGYRLTAQMARQLKVNAKRGW